MESSVKEEKQQPIIRINTKKYSAVPMENAKKENMFIVTNVARKSSIKAKTTCPECGSMVSRYDMRICSFCGGESCINCVQESNGVYLCTDCLQEQE